MRWSAPAYAAVIAFAGGVALELLTYWIARSGPVGDGWSFRGNGALIVPIGLGPALLAGGWTAIVLRHRGTATWRRLGIGAAVVGALPAIGSVLALLLLGRSGQQLSDVFTLPALAWPLVALVIALIAPVNASLERPSPIVAILAALVFTAAAFAGFASMQLILPPGSS